MFGHHAAGQRIKIPVSDQVGRCRGDSAQVGLSGREIPRRVVNRQVIIGTAEMLCRIKAAAGRILFLSQHDGAVRARVNCDSGHESGLDGLLDAVDEQSHRPRGGLAADRPFMRLAIAERAQVDAGVPLGVIDSYRNIANKVPMSDLNRIVFGVVGVAEPGLI